MALFGRVGGGIYTKAADVGADLVGKVERNIPEDDPSNPAKQLIISTALMTVGVAVISWLALPAKFTIFNFGAQKEVSNWGLFFCVALGLWAGLIIGFVTEYYTSNAYSPVQDVADSYRTGAATNVIFSLALGYKSLIIPIFAIAVSIYASFSIDAMYDIAMAALGMLSTMATGLAIDAYGPNSDNAGGIAEMAGMSHRIRERTDALDAAGATSAWWMAVERSSSRTSMCCSTARFTPKR
ncbi:Pyrophosphate-energized vacuolar membrane proton pump [Hordeum vulgare]|nr:Pyrophosphate-energized vacuolar membrane proton pump [Hordeum vulgare]